MAVTQPLLRPAALEEAESIARIWHAGWIDGHLGHVPDELVATRSLASFERRAPERLADTTVAVIDGVVTGFVMCVEDEIEQIYVDASHRGTGVSGLLMAEGERQIAAAGHQAAWLAVVAGNARARSFYAKRGWIDAGPFAYVAHGDDGPVEVACCRYIRTFLRPG